MNPSFAQKKIKQALGLKNDHIFIKYGRTIISFKDLNFEALKLAKEWQKKPETFFAIQLTSPIHVFTYSLAAFIAKKKILFLSPQLPPQALSEIKKSIPFQALLSDKTITPEGDGSDLLKQDLDVETPYLYLLSSGSSGAPKAIGHSLTTLIHSACLMIDELLMKKDEVTLLNLPLWHIGGMMSLWRSYLSEGMIDTDTENFDYASFVPLQLKRMMEDSRDLIKLKKAKALLIGGSPFSEDLKSKARLYNISFYETYGMTETAAAVMLNGRPLPRVEIELRNQRFFIKTSTLSPGFYRDGQYVALPLTSDGFFETQDNGIQKDNGDFEFRERADLLFKSAGELINPLVIEQTLKELPFVKEAVVVALPHAKWTWATTCMIEFNNGKAFDINIEECLKTLKQKLHPYQIPKFFFPYLFQAHLGKPSRHQLKSEALRAYGIKSLSHSFFPAKNEQQKLLVLLHGFMGSKEDMNEFLKFIHIDESTATLTIDLPGHGETLTENFFSRETIFRALEELITLYQGSSALYLYGYSMGGRIALELATRKQLTVTELLMESASFGLSSNEERQARMKNDSQLFRKVISGEQSLTEFFDQWYNVSFFLPYKNSDRYIEDRNKKLDHSPNEWQTSLDYFSPGKGPLLHQTLSALESLSLTVYGLVGALDVKYCEHYKEVSSKMALHLSVIDQAGHNPHKTHPEETASYVTDFVRLK